MDNYVWKQTTLGKAEETNYKCREINILMWKLKSRIILSLPLKIKGCKCIYHIDINQKKKNGYINRR